MLVVMLQARSVVPVVPSASGGVLLGYLDLDLVKAALMPETMTEPHLGHMWGSFCESLGC